MAARGRSSLTPPLLIARRRASTVGASRDNVGVSSSISQFAAQMSAAWARCHASVTRAATALPSPIAASKFDGQRVVQFTTRKPPVAPGHERLGLRETLMRARPITEPQSTESGTRHRADLNVVLSDALRQRRGDVVQIRRR